MKVHDKSEETGTGKEEAKGTSYKSVDPVKSSPEQNSSTSKLQSRKDETATEDHGRHIRQISTKQNKNHKHAATSQKNTKKHKTTA